MIEDSDLGEILDSLFLYFNFKTDSKETSDSMKKVFNFFSSFVIHLKNENNIDEFLNIIAIALHFDNKNIKTTIIKNDDEKYYGVIYENKVLNKMGGIGNKAFAKEIKKYFNSSLKR